MPSTLPYDYNEFYNALYSLYNNDDSIIPDDTTRRLRTVVNRSVEFYASKMLPGSEMKVTSASAEVQTAIEDVIKDSNIANNKAPMIRGFALFGDSFIRVRGDKEKHTSRDIPVLCDRL